MKTQKKLIVKIPTVTLDYASGVHLIAVERQCQIEKDGWSAEHDDEHFGGEMAEAAACYAKQAGTQVIVGDRRFEMPREDHWPWHKSSWKPCPRNRIKELVKAGALIAAEIDRLQRRKKGKRSNEG